jgi:hypothetical protein
MSQTTQLWPCVDLWLAHYGYPSLRGLSYTYKGGVLRQFQLQALYYVVNYVTQHPSVDVLNLVIQKDWPFKKTPEINRPIHEW